MPKTYTIKQALVIKDGHPMHTKKVDIRIENGRIADIATSLETIGTEIAGDRLQVSEGWIDMRCHLTDPGNEHKDTLIHLLDTAAAGGFTTLMTLPNSNPPIADKSAVHYITHVAKTHLVELKPMGLLAAVDRAENLSELYDMHTSGASSFTNGDAEVSNGLLKKALLYTKPFGGRVITHPADKSLEGGASISESATTIHTGLKSAPSLAEYLAVKEQIEVAKYCEAAIHFSCISTKESVALVAEAKADGVRVTCDVSIFNLCFTDSSIVSFDENFKVYPPLREEEDRLALIAGVNDGTVDAICSNHHPQNIESKAVEFDYAAYGALSLQLIYPWYRRHLASVMSEEIFVAAIATRARDLLSMAKVQLTVGEMANLTVVDATKKWIFGPETNMSSSKNTHEWGAEQEGRVVAVFNAGKVSVY